MNNPSDEFERQLRYLKVELGKDVVDPEVEEDEDNGDGIDIDDIFDEELGE